ncbi:MAG: succinate dehydrogenase assembly factor 2 [Gammaproteobacteria bacterium]|nr:succinate dehydrogenase assembly factor 2 [Gammaproteobacteria bacterium]MCH9743821.1 succinate dehydrogenase assembly factor 2 [Gammaproteobacteria bacterium]
MTHDPKLLARLSWKCRRGMLELDFFLERFIKNKLEQLDKNQIKTFDAMLDEPDPVLLSWFTGQQVAEDKAVQAMVELISGGENDKDI